MTTIFLSYRRTHADFAGRLQDNLIVHFGDVVFRDVNALAPGADFERTILRVTIPKCKVFLVVIGQNWVGAQPDGTRRIDDPQDLARREVESALKHKIPVIPVLMKDVTMPDAADLPPSLRRLAKQNAIELDDARWNDDLRRLLAAIKPLVPMRAFTVDDVTTVLDQPPAVEHEARPGVGRRGRIVAAGLALGVPALLVVTLIVQTGGAGTTPATTVPPATAPSTSAPSTSAPSTSVPGPTSTSQPTTTNRSSSTAVKPTSPIPTTRVPPTPAPATTNPPPPKTTATTTALPPTAGPLRLQPQSGPAGTTINISADPCPVQTPSGYTDPTIYFGLFDPNTPQGEDVPVKGFAAWVPGSPWQGQLVVPTRLPPGAYSVYANCFATDPSTGVPKKLYEYGGSPFVIT